MISFNHQYIQEKNKQRQEISQHVEQFLKSGGKIKTETGRNLNYDHRKIETRNYGGKKKGENNG